MFKLLWVVYIDGMNLTVGILFSALLHVAFTGKVLSFGILQVLRPKSEIFNKNKQFVGANSLVLSERRRSFGNTMPNSREHSSSR